jgi:hypothetical protein
VATKGPTCIAGKSTGNTGGKAMAKIVARAKDWTRKWEITRKSKPRRHIAWPHNIVCSRWLAQATSELCHIQSKRPFSMVWHDQTSCLEIGVLTVHLVSNCVSVVFWGTEKSVEQNFAQAAAHLPVRK